MSNLSDRNRIGTSTKVLAGVAGVLTLVGVTAGTAMALDGGTDSPSGEVSTFVAAQTDDPTNGDPTNDDPTNGDPTNGDPATLPDGSELLDDLAAELGVTADELRAAVGAVLADRLDEHVAAGRLTPAEADAIVAAFDDGELAELLAERRDGTGLESVLDRAVEEGLLTEDGAERITERAERRADRPFRLLPRLAG